MCNYAIQSRYFSSRHYPRNTRGPPSLFVKAQMTIISFSDYIDTRSLAYIQETYIIPTIFIKLDIMLLWLLWLDINTVIMP